MLRKKNGFTIVELLIVIVVIAILATITVVSYRSLQQRTIRASTFSTIEQYEKAIRIYQAKYGKKIKGLETVDGKSGVYACLVDSSSLPAGDGYSADQCYKRNDVAQISREQLIPYLKEIGEGLGEIAFDNKLSVSDRRAPYIYIASGKPMSINYMLKGQVECHDGKKGYEFNGKPAYEDSYCEYWL